MAKFFQVYGNEAEMEATDQRFRSVGQVFDSVKPLVKKETFMIMSGMTLYPAEAEEFIQHSRKSDTTSSPARAVRIHEMGWLFYGWQA